MGLPAFRSDLEITKFKDESGSYRYLVKDPVSREVFEFGEEEFFLCKQLDGQSSLPDVQARFEERFNMSLNMENLEAFVRKLEGKRLLERYTIKTPSILELFQSPSPETWKRWELFNPERLLTRLAENLWWCYTRPFVIVSSAIFVLAIGVVFYNFNEFLKDIKLLFKPLSIFQVFAALYIFVNIPQELARGMTSARFGGCPDEFGIWLAFNVIPKFYCWGKVLDIREKAKRSWIIFSPSFYSIVVGSIGILIWKMTLPSTFLHKFGLILSVVCIFDSIMRLNFLWPTEASYLLCNWLNIQEFRKRSIKVAMAWLFRRPMPEPLASKERHLFIWYGLLTASVTFSTLVVIAYFLGRELISYLAGLGALIFLTIALVKYGKVFSTLLTENGAFRWLSEIRIDVRYRKRVRLIFWGMSLILILLFPYPYEPGGPLKLLPLEHIELHTQVSGEIKQVFVRENDLVKSGAVQALIDAREHQKNFDVTHAELQKALADLQLLEKGPKPEEVEKAKRQVETAQTQFEYSTKEKDRLSALFREGVISEEEYMDAANRADVDAKNLEVAKANLELVKSGARPEEIEAQKAVVRDLQTKVKYYKENVELTKLLAPISGRVITPFVETKVGQVLKEGDLFAVYENMETIQADIYIPEADIDEVKIGSRVKVRLQAFPTRFFYGDVVLIAPSAAVTSDEKVIRVLTNIPNPKQELKPEMTGEAKIKGVWKPVIVAFTRPVVRFFMVEVWSWFP